MLRTPSALKWLAEKRARLAYDLDRTGRLAAELRGRHALLQSQLAALDATIKLYDNGIEPSAIVPIAAQSKHGKKGVIRKALMGYLASSSPDWVSSVHLEQRFLADFNLSFGSDLERTRWRRNILCSALRKLCTVGAIERLHQPNDGSRDVGYWRLKQSTVPRLADL